jgi:hypothetical protein
LSVSKVNLVRVVGVLLVVPTVGLAIYFGHSET